jgi:hypothetical protein
MEVMEGCAGLDEVEGNIDHGITREAEGENGRRVFIQDDWDRAQTSSSKINRLKVVVVEIFFL